MNITVTAGTAVLVTSDNPPFTTESGVVSDPTTVTLKYGGLGRVTITVNQSSLTHVSTGVWSYTMDTTGMAGTYAVQFIGTGACAAVNVGYLTVKPAP